MRNTALADHRVAGRCDFGDGAAAQHSTISAGSVSTKKSETISGLQQSNSRVHVRNCAGESNVAGGVLQNQTGARDKNRFVFIQLHFHEIENSGIHRIYLH